MDAKICFMDARGCVKTSLSVVLMSCLFLFYAVPTVAQDGLKPDSPASFLADDLDCRHVFGVFKANPLPPEECTSPFGLCSLGQLYGMLRGTYEMTVDSLSPTGNDEIPFVNFFTGESFVTTKKEGLMVGIDTGSLNGSPPGTPGSGKFSTLLTFVDGAVGYLFIHGTTNLISGTTTGRYSGLVCSE